MSTAADVADHFFGFYQSVFRQLDTAMTESGLSYSKYKILHLLETRGACRLTEIAEHFAFAPRSITEAVDNLERDGLAAREPDPTDRRAKLVSITAEGRAAVEATKKIKAKVVQHIFGRLSEPQRAAFSALLAALSTTTAKK